jgi:hypothetical protein
MAQLQSVFAVLKNGRRVAFFIATAYLNGGHIFNAPPGTASWLATLENRFELTLIWLIIRCGKTPAFPRFAFDEAGLFTRKEYAGGPPLLCSDPSAVKGGRKSKHRLCRTQFNYRFFKFV